MRLPGGTRCSNPQTRKPTPMAPMTFGFATAAPLIPSIAMIWLAHIGFDRALGYGLKYQAGFGFTHLGRIGKAQV
ncbi:DUF4260 family protein [Bradyrhizobium sp.]|uniref:DUF4260 family protein n=1 Tax=Bradyrhizobium sp. TaxID=376 RepID=UPI003C730533